MIYIYNILSIYLQFIIKFGMYTVKIKLSN